MERKSANRLLSPIRPRRISDEVYKQVVSLISSGHFKPGEKLPSERDMAAGLRISRQSLREALHGLVVVGLIEVRPGEGSFVRSSIRSPLKAPLTVIIEKEAERIFEFLEIRKAIEGWCAEKAAREGTGEDFDKMERILAAMKEITLKDKRWEELDMAFHFSIAEATHNLIAMHIMDALKVSFATFFHFRSSITSSEKMEVLWVHHKEILDAIRQRNSASAKRKVIDHLDFIEMKIQADVARMKR